MLKSSSITASLLIGISEEWGRARDVCSTILRKIALSFSSQDLAQFCCTLEQLRLLTIFTHESVRTLGDPKLLLRWDEQLFERIMYVARQWHRNSGLADTYAIELRNIRAA